jgi:hypothetical protein
MLPSWGTAMLCPYGRKQGASGFFGVDGGKEEQTGGTAAGKTEEKRGKEGRFGKQAGGERAFGGWGEPLAIRFQSAILRAD